MPGCIDLCGVIFMGYLKRFWLLYAVTAAVFVLICVKGSEAATTMAESAPFPRQHVFVIDAGHGGEDGGAVSCTGVKESGINLQIALRLNDLMHLLGHKTVMIRTTDCSVHTGGSTIAQRKASDLQHRAAIVRQAENSVLVSIHQNHYAESIYSGAQMFYNDVPGSQELAQRLQEQFVTILNPGSHRKCKPVADIYLLEHIDRPGVLVECGFLSNPEEEQRLRQADYQKKICCVIAASLSTMGLDLQTND